MKVLIDADACPVTDICIGLSAKYGVACVLLCDTSHEINRSGVTTLVFDKGADSVDFALVNRVNAGDVVITQDYGLAAMCLAKGAQVLHQDGWAYTQDNIQGLLAMRHAAKKHRMAGSRTKGPAKRTRAQDDGFYKALEALLQNSLQG